MHANLLAGRPHRTLALFDRCNTVLALKQSPSSSFSSSSAAATTTATTSAGNSFEASTPSATATAAPRVVTAEGPASAAVAAASAASVMAAASEGEAPSSSPGGYNGRPYMCSSSVTYRRVLEVRVLLHGTPRKDGGTEANCTMRRHIGLQLQH